jgi:hypothetical protein
MRLNVVDIAKATTQPNAQTSDPFAITSNPKPTPIATRPEKEKQATQNKKNTSSFNTRKGISTTVNRMNNNLHPRVLRQPISQYRHPYRPMNA